MLSKGVCALFKKKKNFLAFYAFSVILTFLFLTLCMESAFPC